MRSYGPQSKKNCLQWLPSRSNSNQPAQLHRPAKIVEFGMKQVHMSYLAGGAGPRSAVGNVSGYRCVSDCRSRGREFDPGPVPYFHGD